MFKISKISLILILLTIFILLSGFFAVKWAQKEIKEVKTEKSIEEGVESKKVDVTITTDKTEYKQGEVIKITVMNNSDRSIWYYDSGCYPWWELEAKEGRNWQSKKITPPILTKFGEECISCPPPKNLEELIFEMKPKFKISNTWNLRNCEIISGKLNLVSIKPGAYRVSFCYGFTKDSYREKIIYSNEFIVKK